MGAPDFWFAPPDKAGWRAWVLAPAAAVATWLTARRVARPGIKSDVPVICVGNLNLGGTGKTPTVIALLERLSRYGRVIHIVSRGYGGQEKGPLRVDPRKHKAADVGDEPLLLAAFAPVWIARDRAAGVKAAASAGAELIILDDGFQNPSVRKDFSIIVADAAVGFGNGRVVPAGPLREPVAIGLTRADCVLAIGEATAIDRFRSAWDTQIDLPVLAASLQPLLTGMDWQGLRVLAFAGIGRPEKFFATLRALDVDLLRAEALDDHQVLSEPLMNRLEAEATALGAQLVTTEKDAVRLPESFRQRVLTLPVRLRIEDTGSLDEILLRAGINP